MSNAAPAATTLRIASLSADRPYPFALTPDAATRARVAQDLGIPAIRKLRFVGSLIPEGRDDWRLEAELGATVVQDCVVSLAPVTTRIDTPVTRRFLAEPPAMPDEAEVEMPEDDTIEPLPPVLDLIAVMTEALALALPDYPHAEGVTPLLRTYTEPGREAMSDEAAKPFAGLAGLRDQLGSDDD